MCVFIPVNMSLLSMPLSFFVWSIVGQTKVISGMKKCKALLQNLHIVKNVNESLSILSFWTLPKFTNKLLFIHTCLIFSCQKVGKKIETVAWTPYFNKIVFIYWIITCNVYFAAYGREQITGTKNYYFASSPRAFYTNLLSLALYWLSVNFENNKLWNNKEEFCALQAFRGLVEKLRSLVLCDTNRPFKQQKYSFIDKRIVYQTFCSALLMFRNFSSRKRSVYWHALASRFRNCYCLLLSNKISCRNKIYLQPCLRQIVHSNDRELSIKVSITCHAHCFCFFQGKVLCIGTHWQAVCKMVIDFISSD